MTALRFKDSCPLCRGHLESPVHHKYSTNIVLTTILEKNFKRELKKREEEEQREAAEIKTSEIVESDAHQDADIPWGTCFPFVRQGGLVSVILSCTN